MKKILIMMIILVVLSACSTSKYLYENWENKGSSDPRLTRCQYRCPSAIFQGDADMIYCYNGNGNYEEVERCRSGLICKFDSMGAWCEKP